MTEQKPSKIDADWGDGEEKRVEFQKLHLEHHHKKDYSTHQHRLRKEMVVLGAALGFLLLMLLVCAGEWYWNLAGERDKAFTILLGAFISLLTHAFGNLRGNSINGQ